MVKNNDYEFLKNQDNNTNSLNNKLKNIILPKRFNNNNSKLNNLSNDFETNSALKEDNNNFNNNIKENINQNNDLLSAKKTESYTLENKVLKLDINHINKEIGLEISLFKIKSSFLIFFSCLLFFYSLLNIFFHFYSLVFPNFKIKLLFDINYILWIFFASISLLSIIYNVIVLSNFISYGKIYSGNTNNNLLKANIVPEFLKNILIKRIKTRYYIILLTAIIYTTSLLLFPILYSLQSHTGQPFSFAWWKLGIMPDIKNVIIFCWVTFGVVTFLFILNVLLNENRKKTIEKFSVLPIISEKEKEEIIKKTRRVCIIIYISYISLILVFVLLFFLISFFKKRYKKR